MIHRARSADERVLPDAPDAIVDTGDPYSPWRQAHYTGAQLDMAEPYPGLRAFPAAIEERDLGAPGEIHDGQKRQPEDFVAWIDELLERSGGKPSSLPTEQDLPQALPRPERGPSPDAAADSAMLGSQPPSVATAVGGALTLVGVLLTVILAPRWAAGGAIAFVLSVAVLRRWVWTWRPKAWATVLVVAITVMGAAIGHWLSPDPQSRKLTTPPRTTSAAHSASPPLLDRQATCASIQRSDYRGQHGNFGSVGSPGQIGGGDALAVRVLPDGHYSQVARVATDSKIEFSVELQNTQYGAVTGMSVEVRVTASSKTCVEFTASSHSRTHPGGDAALGRIFVVGARRPIKLQYLADSAELLNSNGKTLAHLPGGVLTSGVQLPYAIPAGPGYFVSFLVRAL